MTNPSNTQPLVQTLRAPELLMPAGDPEKMKYAFAYGADAVYAGVPIFSLRARENGFKTDSLRQAIADAHAIGKKVYLTMNIYAHNSRVENFLNSFCEMADLEPDGFIMSDVGLIHKVKKLRPNAIIHLSTQANATNWTAVEFWRDMGVERVVLSRELSLKEIAEIHRRVPEMELEAFVHGSICIAYSGRCLISNYLSHRDANEGTCTNSCRWEYSLGVQKQSLKEFEMSTENELLSSENDYEPLAHEYYVKEKNRLEQKFELDEDEHGTYMMNSKDLCAIELLKDLMDVGVVSFKVEGRSKGLYYVAAISRAYRRAIDDVMSGRPFQKENLLEAISTSNRTLMTGFLLKRPQEYGQNYSDGASQASTHQYGGQVLEIRLPTEATGSCSALLLAKNRLRPGDAVEWITPTETISGRLSGPFFRKDGKAIDALHGGEAGWIPCPTNLQPLSLLRLPLEGVNSPTLDACATLSPQEGSTLR